MAKDYSSKGYVVVEKGDTLWAIAKKYLGAGSKYTQLVTWNKGTIKNPDLIYVGQKIYLNNTASSSSSSSSSSNSNAPYNVQMGLLSTADDTLMATWDWSKSKTESYKVLWTYDLGNGVEIQGNLSTISVDEDAPDMAQQSLYTIPDGARKVYFKVKPIAESKEQTTTSSSDPDNDVSKYTDLTVDNITKIENLYDTGSYSASSIAKKLGISENTVETVIGWFK